MPLDPVKVDIRSTFDAAGTAAATREMGNVGAAAKRTAGDTDILTQADKQAAVAAERFVQSLRQEAETLGMTSLQVKAYAASKKNFTDAQALSVAGSLSAIKAHEEEQARVEKVAAAVGFATKALVAFAAARAAATVLSVKSVIAEADDLNKESQALGVAVEWLSKFRYAGDLANVSSDQLRNGLRQLTKQIEEADNGTGNGRQLFAQMGISITDVTGKVKTLDQLLPELADKFAGYAEGPRKTALALELFSRDGLRWVPLLNAGAQGLRDNAAEAERLGIVIDGDLAAKSEAFRDKITQLDAAFKGLKLTLAQDVLPELSRTVNEMNVFIKTSDGVISGLAKWAVLGQGSPFAQPVGERLATNQRELALLQRNVGQSPSPGQASEMTALSRAIERDRELQRGEALARWTPGARDELARFGIAPKPDAPNIPRVPRGGGGGSSSDPYAAANNYVLSLQNQLESASGEATTFDKTVREITEGTKKWTEELKANALAIAGEIDEVKAAKQALDAYLKTLGFDMEARKEQVDLMTKRSDAVGKANMQAYDEAERIKFETSLLKLNAIEREKVIALRKMEAEKPAGMMPGGDHQWEFDRNVANVQAAIDARGRVQDEIEGVKKAEDAIKRLTEDTSRSITDAIISGGNNGFRDLGKIALRTFQNLVLRPLIEPQIRTAAGETIGWAQGLAKLFGSGSAGFDVSAYPSHAQNLGAVAGAFPMEHSGYGPGDPYGPSKMVSAAVFARAPRFHDGIGPNERPAIIRRDESVLTPGQMRQLAPVAQQPMRIEIVNSGAPKEVQSATPRIDVDGAVTRVVLADVARNGPIAQGLTNTYNLRR